jgi:hypothetical protein
MSRKDYEHLAAILGAALAVEYRRKDDRISATAERIVDEVAYGLADTNPRYDRSRFVAAVFAEARRYEASAEA